MRLLRSIGITVGSMFLFFLINTIYFLSSFGIADETFVEVFLNALASSLFFTVIVFFSLLYFPIQVGVLVLGRFVRILLLILPLAASIIAFFVVIYYLVLVDVDLRPLDSSFLAEYLWLSLSSAIFVVLNNIVFIRYR